LSFFLKLSESTVQAKHKALHCIDNGNGIMVKTNHYDEASSGSDSNDDSDDESQGEMIDAGNATNLMEKDKKIPSSDGGDADGDDDDDSDDSDSDSNSADSGNGKEDESPSNNNNDDNYNSDDDDDDLDNDEDLPLHERLRRQDNDFSRIRKSRERKAQALEVASERLATFKQAQKKKNNKKRKAMVGDDDDDDDDDIETQSNNSNTKKTSTMTTKMTTKKKKKSKHKPTEVSSKRADFFGRGAPRLNESGVGVDIGAHRYKPQDPRASNLSGHFDEDNFQHNYAFLEEMRNKEIGQVRKRISAHKATGNKGNRLRRKLQINPGDGTQTSTLEDDEIRLKFLTETRADLDRRKIEREAKRSVTQKIRSDVESGKSGVYHLKRKERYRLELEAKLEVIQKRGGDRAVEKILEKKRQKNKTRDAARFAR
jgi:ribosomal RNA-processing protein 36